MRESSWKIIFTVQILLILLISTVLSFRMGVFDDVRNQIIHNVMADDENFPEEKQKSEDLTKNTPTTKQQPQPIKTETVKTEETKKELVKAASVEQDDEEKQIFIKKSDSEVQAIIEKYKDNTKKTFSTVVTSYNSEAGQTDDSPCITASGMNVCDRNTEDILATNDLPFHTKVLIPEYFGERIFYVEDRMNKRYTDTGRIDIWMKNKVDSKSFGARSVKIIVLK